MRKPDFEDGILFGCGAWLYLIIAIGGLSLLWLAIYLAKAVIRAL